MQQVKITVEVDGEVVDQLVEQVDGTLEQMEEKIDVMTRQLAVERRRGFGDDRPDWPADQPVVGDVLGLAPHPPGGVKA